MRKLTGLIVGLFIIISSCVVSTPLYTSGGNGGNPQEVNEQLFYDALSPYGTWVNSSDYGYIWYPDVNNDFYPYASDGRWVYTDYGWTWVSDYPWGWAAFHYGTWDFDADNGWFWVPGYDWAPSWVIWRRADGFYGWEPMRPGMNEGMSIRDGLADPDRWVFVPDRDFDRPDPVRYFAARNNNMQILRNSRIIDNVYVNNDRRGLRYNSGPDLAEVSRATGRNIGRVFITESDRPGTRLSRNNLQIYRPNIQRSNGMDVRPAPPSVRDLDEINRERNRNSNLNRENNELNRRSYEQRQRNTEQEQNQLNMQRNQRNEEEREQVTRRQQAQQQRAEHQQQSTSGDQRNQSRRESRRNRRSESTSTPVNHRDNNNINNQNPGVEEKQEDKR